MAIVRMIETTTHGRVLIDAGSGPQPRGRSLSGPLLVGFHGYGQNAEAHLEQMRRIPATDGWTMVAVQGLHRFYAPRSQDVVVASWMTRQDREVAIADNVAYVDRVMAALASENGAASPVVYLGFSQGVAMAYRAAVFGAVRADGVIALGGDVPPDVGQQEAARFPKVLLARGAADSWFTEQRLHADVELLQAKHVDVRVAVCAGGHEWTDDFQGAASRFLNSLTNP